MKLNSKNVAILATNGFEQSELFEPMKALKNEGANVHIVSLEKGEIKGWKDGDWGDSITVDRTLDEVTANDYNALVLPGGVLNPDTLRTKKIALDFVKSFVEAKKPVGAICHAPWLLVSSEVVKGRDVTSYNSIKDDLINAGANWHDKSVVCDEGLVTSRNPNDLPDFNSKLIEEIKEGKH
ncbi:type 1 glutamine amidotransferase domain-containing protein [Tenacibaculum sp. IB213877]|uniref:type 1 glutamine amidotransferase domain-containing protein n=1 Tax=Tenacibaculum sp. IB213877 TaxID=3097351 RepID=UPI002A5AD9B5|nr:type 1 glutamine amidotransferase domain-containing protein [Tenacibaculum sp. IB213877]MDY0779339.1 type 1 glutamine amidotransferase domain-containing protein [Tenacibaculum sp. IB213877]